MKVTLPRNYKDNYYICEVEAMRVAIKALKDDTTKPADILKAAAKHWASEFPEEGFCGEPIAVTVVSVETCKNYSIQYDQICDGSQLTDVEVFGFVNYWQGTLRIFVNLTDYWFNNSDATVTVAKYPKI